jgi:DNA-directed RNA polymerase
MTEINQQDLNKDMASLGLGRYRQRNESAKARDAELETRYGQRLMRASLPDYATQITNWINSVKKQNNQARYQIDVQGLHAKLIAFVALKSVLDSITKKRSIASLSHYVGARIEDECRCKFLLENNTEKGSGILLGAKRKKGKQAKQRHLRSSMKGEAEKGLMAPWVNWKHRDKLNCGLHLVEILRQSTSLIEYVYIVDSRRSKRPTRYVSATADTLDWIENFNNHRELLEPFWLPTVELPIPWTSVWDGGYDTKGTALPKAPFIKTPNMEYLRGIDGELVEPMKATNLIQQTPWTVNTKVLDVMKRCWEESIQVGDLPSRDDEALPPIPKDFKTNEEANKLWRQQSAKIYAHRLSTTSRRLLVAKILYVATKLSGARFFYPSQVDFRGRIYNIPAFLGIQGPDMSRGLLHFSRPQRVKEDKWLAIQGANTYGNDKVTLDERVEWARGFANTADAIACDPFSNTEWMKADDPWQFLAWCFEWAEYCAKGTVNSKLPVNMDASNNGLQILSMLMRDEYGCLSTNVLPTNTPADIYKVVSDKVINCLTEDEATGNPIASDWLKFGINRKLSKRPTMVWPYGGTFYSCRAYVDEWYQDTLRKTRCSNPFDESVQRHASGYLAKHTWNCINEVLIKPKECMQWLQGIAVLLAKHKLPVRWVTPSGFPVLQDYKQTSAQHVQSNINGQATHVKWHADTEKISLRRQKQGISPNYVHSLDATALTKSVISANERGIYDFSMIHDSYGTHANNCDMFGEVLREEFADIFSVDLLQNLKYQIEQQHPTIKLSEPPRYGNADISKVCNSTYFFC